MAQLPALIRSHRAVSRLSVALVCWPPHVTTCGDGLSQALRLEDEGAELYLSGFEIHDPSRDAGDGPEQGDGDGAPARRPPFDPAAVALEAHASGIAIELEYVPNYSQGDVRSHSAS